MRMMKLGMTMKNRIPFVCVLAMFFCVGTASGMLSQKELSEVQPIVAELMKPSVDAFKAKKMSGSDVGDKALELAESASTEAAVFMCMKGAVTYYARDKAYDKAADAINAIMGKFPDMPPEILLEITTSATRNVSAKSAQRLFDLHKMASRQVTNAKKLKTLKAQLKKTPADKDLICRYAELTAAGGNWDEALKNFAKLGGDTGKMAQDELDGNAAATSLADFWWDYKVQESGAKDAIRQRAAAHYQDAIDSGALEGLKLVRAENRIAESKEINPQAASVVKPKVEYKFNYRLDNKGNAILCQPFRGEPCLSPKPEGALTIPANIDGHKIIGIDCGSFVGCDKVTRIVLPPELGNIDPAVFEHCSSLDRLEIAKANLLYSSIDGVLYSKDLSKLIVYPKLRDNIKLSPKTKVVEKNAFRGCMFKEVKIPAGIKWIGCWNFGDCANLETIEFPASLSFLGYGMFGFSNNLRKIVFNGDAPQTEMRRQSLMSCATADIVVEVKKGSKGWAGPGSTNLPERWPLNAESRPIRYITK